MSDIKLNLARKWRSRTFDEVVGQELPIRMLKNSLYLDHYFPVYLFSGQRGCGKTTAARIFAGAINCEKLPDFQKSPKEIIPCLLCQSCLAMKKGNHPDFIEIDAASHTGVDNVRNIIDAASLMPLLGRKKIYLIDEAHMLSKAAFNAFLKILEEPPASVFFILATTDPHKIIDTVKSRCFQVFFRALESKPLINHLAYVCEQEKIPYQQDALTLLVKQTEGSVRDALNLLEQVRFTARQVNKQAVLLVLGHLDDERLFVLLDKAFNGTVAELLAYLQEISFESFSATILWQACIEKIRLALWYKYKVIKELPEKFEKSVINLEVVFLTKSMQLFYSYEPLFLKTRTQHRVLEHILVQICSGVTGDIKSSSENNGIVKKQNLAKAVPEKSYTSSSGQNVSSPEWQTFLQKIETLDDPLVISVFKQGEFRGCKDEVLAISFPENFSFFSELLSDTKKTWQPFIKELFGESVRLNATFDVSPKQINVNTSTPVTIKKSEQKAVSNITKSSVFNNPVRNYNGKNSYKKVEKKPMESVIDVSDENTWKKAHLILKIFPGTIVEIPKG